MRQNRVVGIRESFDKPEPSKAGNIMAVAILVLVMLQLVVLCGHWVWQAECWAAASVHRIFSTGESNDGTDSQDPRLGPSQ